MKKIVGFRMEVILLSFHKQLLEICGVFYLKNREYFKILQLLSYDKYGFHSLGPLIHDKWMHFPSALD